MPKVEKAIKDDEDLVYFHRILREFDEDLCNNMFRGKEFTLKFEVRGVNRHILSCRVINDKLERPANKKEESDLRK